MRNLKLAAAIALLILGVAAGCTRYEVASPGPVDNNAVERQTPTVAPATSVDQTNGNDSSSASASINQPSSPVATSANIAEPTPIVSIVVDDKPVPVKNLILFIGDGMGFSHINATRLWKHGQNGSLAMDELTSRAVVTTSSADNEVTDSAAAATAIATGVKTNNGFISVAPNGSELTTIMEQAITSGMATGVVVTSSVTHATPAAFLAHNEDRDRNNAIALQEFQSGVDVLLGGGLRHFIQEDVLTSTAAEPQADACPGRRRDVNLLLELQQAGYEVAFTREGLMQVDTAPLIGLFACGSMNFDLQRQEEEPTLAEMTRKAIELLSPNPNGFFLVVEGSRIDHAADDNDGLNTLGDTAAFDEAVKVGLDFANSNADTLIVVTADHETGGLTVRQPASEQDIQTGPRIEIIPSTASSQTLIILQWTTREHTSQNVLTAAFGPHSDTLPELIDNTDIYRFMADALGLNSGGARPAEIAPPVDIETNVQQGCGTRVETLSWDSEGDIDDGVLRIGLTGHANFWWKGSDNRGNNNLERARMIANLMNDNDVDFTVWLGDDFRLCDREQIGLFTAAAREFEQPIHKVVGNHDLDEFHGQIIHPLQRQRFQQLFGHDIYWSFDTEDYRFLFLADELALGPSYVSKEQIAFLENVLNDSPNPVLAFAHHTLPVRNSERIDAMIGSQSLNVRQIFDVVMASDKVIFWGWGHHHSTGRQPVLSRGIVEYTPHFITASGDNSKNSLEASILTIEGNNMRIDVIDVFTRVVVQTFSFDVRGAAGSSS